MMKRIMIIGCGGSGKSTLTTQLGEKLSLPVHHLDRLFWQRGWKGLPKDEWRKTQEKLCAEPGWILDGNYGGTMDIRFAAADTIIFLDVSTLTCLLGAIKRFVCFCGRTRPDMTEGCPERLERQYLKWIWTYRRTRRPGIMARLDAMRSEKKIIILTSRGDVRYFLDAKQEPANKRMQQTSLRDATDA